MSLFGYINTSEIAENPGVILFFKSHPSLGKYFTILGDKLKPFHLKGYLDYLNMFFKI